jgi:hypothetical protein
MLISVEGLTIQNSVLERGLHPGIAPESACSTNNSRADIDRDQPVPWSAGGCRLTLRKILLDAQATGIPEPASGGFRRSLDVARGPAPGARTPVRPPRYDLPIHRVPHASRVDRGIETRRSAARSSDVSATS